MNFDEEVTSYGGSRTRVMALAQGLDDTQLATVVPCCPRWTVRDLLGHLTGLIEDRGTGRAPTGEFEKWTDEQVDRHRGQSVGEVLATWEALEPERSDAVPSLQALAFDAVVHEHDLFHAVSAPFDAETDSVRVGAGRAGDRMASVLANGAAPGVVVRTEDGERTADGNGGLLGLRTGRLGLMRLVTGRMSEAQARALEWDDDPSEVLRCLFADGFFSLQPHDVLGTDGS